MIKTIRTEVYETHISAEQSETGKNSRIFKKDVYKAG